MMPMFADSVHQAIVVVVVVEEEVVVVALVGVVAIYSW